MMNDSQQLRESIWDLVYGLLSEEESQALIGRIKSEPAAARLYSEVRLQADLIEQAARVGDDSLVFNSDTATQPKIAKTTKMPAAARLANATRTRAYSRRIGAWLAGIGATALAVLLAIGFAAAPSSDRPLAAAFVAADVIAPAQLQAGLTNEIELKTYRIGADGEPALPASVQVEVKLIDQGGQEQLREAVQTDQSGRARVELRGEALSPGVELTIATANQQGPAAPSATASQQAVRLATVLPVVPEPQINYVLQSEPPTDSQKLIAGAVWSFPAFSASQVSIEPVEVSKESLDRSQQGQVALAEPRRRSAEESVQLQAAAKTDPAARVSKDSAGKLQIELPQAQDRFAPGQEVELDLRVTDEAGRPASKVLLGVRVWNEELTKKADEQPLAITDAVQDPASPLLKKNVAGEQQGQKLELAQSLNRFNRDAAADQNVATPSTEPRGEAAAPSVQDEEQRSLAERAVTNSGPVVLATSRAEVTALYRQAISDANAERRQTRKTIGAIVVVVSVTLLVIVAVLALLRIAGSYRVMAPALLMATGGLFLGFLWIQRPNADKRGSFAMVTAPESKTQLVREKLEAGDAYRVEGYVAPAEAAAPATTASVPEAAEAKAPAEPALAAGGERGRSERLSEKVELDRQQAAEQARASRGGKVGQRGAAGPAASYPAAPPRGGTEVAPPVNTLADQQAPASSGGAQPLPGLAGGFAAGREAAKPATAKAKGLELRDQRADAKSIAVEAPAALYFDPQLTTDENGHAKVRFTMPGVESEYRLMVDALGNNRIGSRQEILVCGPGAPAAAAKPPQP